MIFGEIKISTCTWTPNLASKQMQDTYQSKISISGNDDVIDMRWPWVDIIISSLKRDVFTQFVQQLGLM